MASLLTLQVPFYWAFLKYIIMMIVDEDILVILAKPATLLKLF